MDDISDELKLLLGLDDTDMEASLPTWTPTMPSTQNSYPSSLPGPIKVSNQYPSSQMSPSDQFPLTINLHDPVAHPTAQILPMPTNQQSLHLVHGDQDPLNIHGGQASYLQQEYVMNMEVENYAALPVEYPNPNPNPNSNASPPMEYYNPLINHHYMVSSPLHDPTLPLGYYVGLQNQVSPLFMGLDANILNQSWETLLSFLNGKQVYRCDNCRVEFPNGQALGGHMSYHTRMKKNEELLNKQSLVGKVPIVPMKVTRRGKGKKTEIVEDHEEKQ